MKPKVWTYEDPEKQTVHYRGFVQFFEGQQEKINFCKEVRVNKMKANNDAQKLLAVIKKDGRNTKTIQGV